MSGCRFRRPAIRLARSLMTALTLAGAKSKGDVVVEEEGSRLLYVAAPPPFITGITMPAVNDEFPLRFIPPVDEAEKLSFQEPRATGIR